MNNTQNLLIVSHDELYGKQVKEYSEDKSKNTSEHFIKIFSYNNLVQEYDFCTGATALYLRIPENQYEILYENTDKNNSISNVFFYSKKDAFITTYNNDTNSIIAVDHMAKSDFVTFFNKLSIEPNFICMKKLKDLYSKGYLQTHSVRLIQNNISFADEDDSILLDKYKKIFVKYTSATQLIPVYNIINACISEIHQFIATNKLDYCALEKRVSELENFKQVCPSSVSTLSSFLENPSDSDLRNLCTTLENNLQNVDNLLGLYLEDELKIQTNERND